MTYILLQTSISFHLENRQKYELILASETKIKKRKYHIYSNWKHTNINRLPTIFCYWNARTFQGLSRTLKFHFQGPILNRSLQHEQ